MTSVITLGKPAFGGLFLTSMRYRVYWKALDEESTVIGTLFTVVHQKGSMEYQKSTGMQSVPGYRVSVHWLPPGLIER